MAKYYYDRHYIKIDTKKGENNDSGTASLEKDSDFVYMGKGLAIHPTLPNKYTISENIVKVTKENFKKVMPNIIDDKTYFGLSLNTTLDEYGISKNRVYQVLEFKENVGPYSYYRESFNRGVITRKYKGAYIDTIQVEDGTYPNDGYREDGTVNYWYVKKERVNQSPTISGEDTNLGEKNQPFEISYKVEDGDITDNVTVTEHLNNSLIRRITNANNTDQTLKITSELLNSCPLGETNTIKIYAEDEKGAGTYRNYWFKRTNTPPYFLEESKDLGTIKKAPTVSFTAKDDDGDKYLKAKVKINQRVVKVYDQLGNGEQVSFTLDWKDFMQLNHSRKHNLWVEVEDSSGALATLKYTFEREVNSIEIVTNTAPLDIKIKLIVFNANIKLGEGATFLQYACNDFGTGNTWEEIQNGVPYEFKNEHVGNDKIGYKCKLTKGTTESEIRSIGGSFI